MSYRIGNGVDFHQLVKERELWIGGVNIPFKKGAEGHSDADVLLHAICDALLGALALGDIGIHFPNTSDEFKNIRSTILLERTMKLISQQGYVVVNIDSTICLQEPKLKKYNGEMKKIIATIIKVSENDVSIKATTTEEMGFIGKGKGIMAYATVLLKKND
jgi:2-C-methyl-D-erythritol 2,4-cyclodiphosphate synthase